MTGISVLILFVLLSPLLCTGQQDRICILNCLIAGKLILSFFPLRFDFDPGYLSDIDSLRWWSLNGGKIWTTKNLTFKSLNLQQQKKVLLFFYITFAIFKLCTTLTTLLFLGGPRQHSCHLHLHQSRVSISYSLLICTCSCGAVKFDFQFLFIFSWEDVISTSNLCMHFFLGSCHFQFQLLMLNFQLPASLHIIQGWLLFSSTIFGGFPSWCCIAEQ